MRDYIILAIIIICIIGLLFLVPSLRENYQQPANKHLIPSINDTNAIMAPNIPMDPQTTFRIGGKYCKELPEFHKNIAPIKGKYTFPIPKLLYDGVWNSNSRIFSKDGKAIESNPWNLICNQFPTKGAYRTNKFFHIPQCYLPRNCYVIDKSIFYGDRRIIPQYNRNDLCEGKDIIYQDMGINAKFKRKCGR